MVPGVAAKIKARPVLSPNRVGYRKEKCHRIAFVSNRQMPTESFGDLARYVNTRIKIGVRLICGVGCGRFGIRRARCAKRKSYSRLVNPILLCFQCNVRQTREIESRCQQIRENQSEVGPIYHQGRWNPGVNFHGEFYSPFGQRRSMEPCEGMQKHAHIRFLWLGNKSSATNLNAFGEAFQNCSQVGRVLHGGGDMFALETGELTAADEEVQATRHSIEIRQQFLSKGIRGFFQWVVHPLPVDELRMPGQPFHCSCLRARQVGVQPPAVSAGKNHDLERKAKLGATTFSAYNWRTSLGHFL